MTTKADGSTDDTEMVAGTYYVKETEAPLGFYKSDEVFTVDLGPGQTATVTLADKPLYDTLKITKKDARRSGIDENLSEPEGEGTLEGAVFLVEYFAGKYDSVDKLPTGKVNGYTDHGRIVFKVVSAEKNQELLKQIPHREVMDMAVIYYADVNRNADTCASFTVTNNMDEREETAEEKLPFFGTGNCSS